MMQLHEESFHQYCNLLMLVSIVMFWILMHADFTRNQLNRYCFCLNLFANAIFYNCSLMRRFQDVLTSLLFIMCVNWFQIGHTKNKPVHWLMLHMSVQLLEKHDDFSVFYINSVVITCPFSFLALYFLLNGGDGGWGNHPITLLVISTPNQYKQLSFMNN